MKKLISLGLIAVMVFLSGCTGTAYDTVAKPLYTTGKALVILNADLISDEKMEELKKLDSTLIRVNTTRDLVKQLEENKEAALTK